MDSKTTISFNDTRIGFSHKTDRQLRKAKRLFWLMNNRLLVKLGNWIIPFIIRWKIPVRSLIKATIFEQFVGGETLTETDRVIKNLQRFGIDAIMDYGAEAKEDEISFDKTCREFIALLNHAASRKGIPFISIKITGLARFDLLAKINPTVKKDNWGFTYSIDHLSEAETIEWRSVFNRVNTICKKASDYNIGVLVDAEESWIQHTIDALTAQMMSKYNLDSAIVFNTIQLYRQNRLHFLKDSFNIAKTNNYMLGVKLVRGAYMEKERQRAQELNYPSPIQEDKQLTDIDFNAAVAFCIENLNALSVIVASHNEISNILATLLLLKHKLPANHPNIHFAQLYGMSDNITYNLAKHGYQVSKYVPYGPLENVIPYLMRRAQENTSVAGHTSRELHLIDTEIKRRKLLKE